MPRDQLICSRCGREGHLPKDCKWPVVTTYPYVKGAAAFLVGACWLAGWYLQKPFEGLLIGAATVVVTVFLLGASEDE